MIFFYARNKIGGRRGGGGCNSVQRGMCLHICCDGKALVFAQSLLALNTHSNTVLDI